VGSPVERVISSDKKGWHFSDACPVAMKTALKKKTIKTSGVNIAIGIIVHHKQTGFVITKPMLRTAVHLQHQP
jgi:hypothetical protein